MQQLESVGTDNKMGKVTFTSYFLVTFLKAMTCGKCGRVMQYSEQFKDHPFLSVLGNVFNHYIRLLAMGKLYFCLMIQHFFTKCNLHHQKGKFVFKKIGFLDFEVQNKYFLLNLVLIKFHNMLTFFMSSLCLSSL